MRTCSKCGSQMSDTQTSCPRCEAAGKTCPGGKHTMDPAWTECVYCKHEQLPSRQNPGQPARFATVVESRMPSGGNQGGNQGRPVTYRDESALQPRPVRPINSPVVHSPGQHSPGQHSPIHAPQSTGGPSLRPRAHTEFRPIPNLASEATSAGRERKIVAILVSYTWSTEGHVYPIREGRNFIGRGKECEVCVPEDTTLSAQNTHITFRQNFVVGDMVSMTGTDVDGVPIEEQFRSLGNYATIRAGSTHFTFITIKPQAAAVAAEPRSDSRG